MAATSDGGRKERSDKKVAVERRDFLKTAPAIAAAGMALDVPAGATGVEIRVQRTVSVHPRFVRAFIGAALEATTHSAGVMGIETEVFYNVHAKAQNSDFRFFTDFNSMAQYESVFLGKLLSDSKYLDMAARAVDMITDEPLDELFVRLRPDDYFMNLRGGKRREFKFEKASPNPSVKPRYRREREYCASKGRLRDVMQINFAFMEDFFSATNNVPRYYCTRFSVERIGCSKLFFDLDNCPVCDQAFLEQDEMFSTQFSGMLLTKPIDTLFMRLTPRDGDFNLSKFRN